MISRTLDVAKPITTRAIHTLDERLSNEVVNGLMIYDFVVQARVVDELDNVLAQKSKQVAETKTIWLTQLLGERLYDIKVDISLSHTVSQGFGYLEVTIDNDNVYAPFYKRTLTIFITGFLRNLLLVMLFFVAFYWSVAKPLARITKEIKGISPDNINVKLIASDPNHQEDELGNLIGVANEYIRTVVNLLKELHEREQVISENEWHKRKIIDTVPHMIYARDQDGRFVFANLATASAYNTSVENIEQSTLKELHAEISVQQMRQFQASDMAVIKGKTDDIST